MPTTRNRGIEVHGADELARALKAADPALVKEYKAANKEIAGMVATTAKGMVPTRSGALAKTVRAGATTKSGVVRAGGTKVPYAGPIHFGWPSRPNPGKGWYGGPIRPNPFLYDALDQRRDEVQNAYLKAVNVIVAKVGRST